jgi:phosphoribosylaminoimidazole-succinocarboxamide synthase
MPLRDLELDLPDRREGKVRISWSLSSDRRLMVTTDRLSAFDRVVAVVPHKGQVLNQLSAWWCEATSDIISNHFVSMPAPQAMVVQNAKPLAVEVVVRGALTGSTTTSLLPRYLRGERQIYGHTFADGLAPHCLLPAPIITPTTKAGRGGHDEPLSSDEVVSRGLIDETTWSAVCTAALALFARGQVVAAQAGLILADTKYEFGVDAYGQLLLIDEIHTPDSSRLWMKKSLADRLAAGREPESVDKEPVRLALAAVGYRGDGPVPVIDAEVIAATSLRYIEAYERITGEVFVAAEDLHAAALLAAVSETA